MHSNKNIVNKSESIKLLIQSELCPISHPIFMEQDMFSCIKELYLGSKFILLVLWLK